MTSDSKRDDSSTEPAPQPKPKADPKEPVTPDSKPWQDEPATTEPESGEPR